MGRPLKKDINGVNVIGTYGTNTPGDTSAGIKCEFYDSALRTDGVIVKQRGAKTFVVTRVGNIGSPNIKDSTSTSTAVLVSTEPAEAGELRILGSTTGLLPATTAIAKITKRVATDFSGNRYTWYMSQYEDSSGDVLVLTAI
jgi:hypothetical protein